MDDWNLKGKQIKIIDVAQDDSDSYKYRHVDNDGVFREDIIETLREKLIEDIDNILVEFASYFGEDYYNLESEYREKAKKSIDKRFGGDE